MARFNVETIDLKFQGRSSVIASFLIGGAGGFILIETGPESTRETLVRRLADRGLSPVDLDAIFVTHIHLDHAGAAGWFAREGVPVYVHQRGAAHLVDPSKLLESARQVYAERFDSLWGGMVMAPENLVRPMADGEMVDVAGLSVTAVETPGHAFHHHAYQIGDTIFAGDAAGARLGISSGYTSVTSAPPQFHLEHTLASIKKLADLSPSRAFLTHFGEIPDPLTHLEDYREAVELNAEFIRQRLLEGLDAESLAVSYEAFQLEQAYRQGLPPELWEKLQIINGTGMCSEGMRLFWERRFAEET